MENKLPRRVKVYVLEEDNWKDQGTGYCSAELEGTPQIPYFIVRNELNSQDLLLKAAIKGSIQYQKQQDTLIVWTDEVGKDYALSFQEPEGCYELCQFLIRVQDKYQPNISLSAVITTEGEGEVTEIIAGPITAPPDPSEGNLGEIFDILAQSARSELCRESMVHHLETQGYLEKMISLFHEAEKSKNIENLRYLCDIVKTLIFYNDSKIMERLIDDDMIIGFVGTLEYDAEFPTYKSNYRQFITDESKFKNVLQLDDEKIKRLFTKASRLQFLKDVVLVRLLDDASFNWMNALICSTQVEIISYLQHSEEFMRKLFEPFSTSDDLQGKRDIVRMLHQFAQTAKTLQHNTRTEFFAALIKHGLFRIVYFALNDTQTETRVLGTELIVSIIEQDALLISEMSDLSDEKSTLGIPEFQNMQLVGMLIDVLLTDDNATIQLQTFEAIKVLLDPINSPFNMEEILQVRNTQQQELHRNTDFIRHFYQELAYKLFGPFIEMSNCQSDQEKVRRSSSRSASTRFQFLCELMSFCCREHDYTFFRHFLLESRCLFCVSWLITSSVKQQCKLAALRCIKSVICLNDMSVIHHIAQNDLLSCPLQVLKAKADCNNMMSSSLLELLSMVVQGYKDSNVRKLGDYLSEKYSTTLELIPLGRQVLELVKCTGQRGAVTPCDKDSEMDSPKKGVLSIDFGSGASAVDEVEEEDKKKEKRKLLEEEAKTDIEKSPTKKKMSNYLRTKLLSASSKLSLGYASKYDNGDDKRDRIA